MENYPPPINISQESIAKLRIAVDDDDDDDDKLELNFNIDAYYKPTLEFQEAVREVIEARQRQPHTIDKVYLSVAIDKYLEHKRITR